MYFIVIRGPLGIGKTTVAKRLAAKLKGEYISIDKILEKNKLDKVTGSHIPLKNFLRANEIILPKASKLLEKKVVVFDGNFYLKKQLQHLLRGLKSKHYVFTLRAPLTTCIERDSKRERIYGKGATKAVYNLVEKFDYGTVIETYGKKSNSVVKEILNKLPKN